MALAFSQDTVRWIRVILSDHQVFRILCTHPGRPVQVWHSMAPEGAETSVIPDRSDMNRFADFLIRSSGKTIDPDSIELSFRFKTGEMVTLTRVMDDQGHYYRIDVRKKEFVEVELETSPGDTRKHIPIPKISSPSGKPDCRIEELLTKIFDRDEGEGRSGVSEEGVGEDPPSVQAGLVDRVLNSIRTGLNGFSLPEKRRKEKPESDEAPIPDTLQVPSVLNIQGEGGTIAEEAYWLFQPHAYAVIVQDRNKDRSYRVIEPELSPRERIILEETHETLRDVLVYDKPVTKGELFLEYHEVAKVVRTYDPKITDDRLSVLYYYLRRNLNGYGKIDALMYDELLEDISCNGHDLPVYIHHRYYGSIPTSVRFETEELNRFVLKLSQKADKQISLTSPLLDASLPNGSRAQITYSDVVSTKGSSFTIRKFRSDPMTPATLMAFGTYSDELLAFIWLALENRQSLIVVGGTASGKTSAMNAFSFFIPHNSKIVSLEDTREIQIPQKNWLPVQTRASNTVNDRGSVDLFDLLKASLRQRPEYIIVGEVRGSEAQTLFQAMNSGHTTLSTLHAGNIEEALNRLTNEPINVPPAMFGALNLMVIQTFHYRDGRMIRRCDAIHEIVLGDGDKVNWNVLFEYEPKDDSFRKIYKKSKTLQAIQYMHNWSEEEIRYHLALRAGFLAKLRNQYSTDPEVLMRMITDLRRLA
ncbi:MAG: type II/IV secretion system ATPase subunit [Methanobacteriota archaeon]